MKYTDGCLRRRLGTEETSMSQTLRFDKSEWFNVIEHLDNLEVVANVWAEEIEQRIPSKNLDFVKETFLRAGLKAYRASIGSSVIAKQVWSASGYSKSTFHRTFDSFGSYQLRLYHFLCDTAIDAFQDYLNGRDRTPEEFCRFSRDCIYSSHLAVPSRLVAEVYRLNSPISPLDFHPYVPRTAEVMHEYVRCRRHLGYREFSKEGLCEVLRTLDYDILFSKVNDGGSFPSEEQALRLERMLLAYLT